MVHVLTAVVDTLPTLLATAAAGSSRMAWAEAVHTDSRQTLSIQAATLIAAEPGTPSPPGAAAPFLKPRGARTPSESTLAAESPR